MSMTNDAAAPGPATTAATAWHGLTPDAALSELGVDQGTRLTAAEVEARRATYGPNRFAEAA